MQLIKEITDKVIFGTDGISNVAPIYTARTILKRRDGMFAIIYERESDLFLTVGVGIEANENIIGALKREVFEETGCRCDLIDEIGYVYENRYHSDVTRYSYFYYVETEGQIIDPVLTDDEKKYGTEVRWYTFDVLYNLISSKIYTQERHKFIQARALAAFDTFLSTKYGVELTPIFPI